MLCAHTHVFWPLISVTLTLKTSRAAPMRTRSVRARAHTHTHTHTHTPQSCHSSMRWNRRACPNPAQVLGQLVKILITRTVMLPFCNTAEVIGELEKQPKILGMGPIEWRAELKDYIRLPVVRVCTQRTSAQAARAGGVCAYRESVHACSVHVQAVCVRVRGCVCVCMAVCGCVCVCMAMCGCVCVCKHRQHVHTDSKCRQGVHAFCAP